MNEKATFDFGGLRLAEEEIDRRILVAVDFGTTYSGVAWAQTMKSEVQSIIVQWPDASSQGLEGKSSDKVPTELRYEGAIAKWGFQIPTGAERHQWFKLELDPTQTESRDSELARLYPSPNALPPAYDTPVEKLVTDYLTALRKHIRLVLEHKLHASVLRSTPIEYIITVPAVWSESAQAKTRSCAEAAGMGNGRKLQIITEPEAAAIYALDTMDPTELKIGDTFVLCDAGGGTVDLISYTVAALKPHLRVDEPTYGTGSLAGSSFLNRIFHKFLQDKFRNIDSVDEETLEEAMEEAMAYFDADTKKSFGSTSHEFLIPVTGLGNIPALGVKRHKLRVSAEEMRAIFDPVVQKVIKLVLDQIRATGKPVTAVLLVGGFGTSGYLFDRLRSAVPRTTQILQSPNGWTAVVRGALMKGLASVTPELERVTIGQRRARKNYGMQIWSRYDETKHRTLADQKRWFGRTKCYRVYVMNWFIKKNDEVDESEPHRHFFCVDSLVTEGPPLDVTAQIYADNNAVAPLTKTDSVKKLVKLYADLSHIPQDTISKENGKDGQEYFVLDYEIQATYSSGQTIYELVYNDIKYDTVKAEYV